MITSGTVAVIAKNLKSQDSSHPSSATSGGVECDDDDDGNGDVTAGDTSDGEKTLAESPPRSPTADQRQWPRVSVDGGNGVSDGSEGSDASGSRNGDKGTLLQGKQMVFVQLNSSPSPKYRKVGRLRPRERSRARLRDDGGGESGDKSKMRLTAASATDGTPAASAGTAAGGVKAGAGGEKHSTTIFPHVETNDGPVVGSTVPSAEEGTPEACRSSDPSESTDRKSRSSNASVPDERILTRLYKGNCFGEMALIYDEPRNASVRALTKVTCVYLHKEAFRKCLCDKTFNKLMEQAALQTACYREQRSVIAGRKEEQRAAGEDPGLTSPRYSASSPRNFASARALATARAGTRSSFRATEKLKFTEDAEGCTNGRVINDYRVCEKVGEGSFGAVFKVVHVHTGQINAMKVCHERRHEAVCASEFRA